jgi:4-amino-4-deoxy-L-arabinose transferase-like glycosyltransferase
VIGPLAIVAGLVCELVILHDNQDELRWLPVVLLAGVSAAAVLLARLDRGRARTAVITGALALLLIAPATWSYQTLGHPANATFPAGGPAAEAVANGATAKPASRAGHGREIRKALRYVRAHGGGTLAVSRQNGVTSQIIIHRGANLAGIGGFSGRESHMTVAAFAGAVARGQVRWVLISGPRPSRHGRPGSATVMAAVELVGTRTPVTRLYLVRGRAGALRRLARTGFAIP